ncbi:helix-turn-helix domain-containing protein [Arthrobacter sp. NicSoilC12]|uniref:helix-turn-helix domain-containing protein n=1 Tax=Micrococcaceae TaxID=1268 RepID=UPI001359D089
MAARPNGRLKVRRHQDVRTDFTAAACRDLRRHLSEPERITIADLLHARRSIRAIARQLGCSPLP